jgi:two-component system NarL family sensor kinase
MSELARLRPSIREMGPNLRRRVVFSFLGLIALACALTAALLLSRAVEEQRSMRERTLGAALALSNDFDQEVAGLNNLLKGLSTSPALRSGDIKAFYDQLKRTPIPEGSWLILHDLEGQLANTLMPFGATLPKHRGFPTSPVDRVRDRGWTVSGRTTSIVRPGTTAVALSLRVDEADGVMKYFVTTILSEARLAAILSDRHLPGRSYATIFDRSLSPIASSVGPRAAEGVAAPANLAARLSGTSTDTPIGGTYEGIDHRGIPVLIAFRRSGLTNWTSVIEVPLSLVHAPVQGMIWQLSGAAALLLLAAGGAAVLMGKPIDALSGLLTSAEKEVGDLSSQLLGSQSDERQRIARELHDSTTQHIVAASLGLTRLERRVAAYPETVGICGEVEASLANALTELRVFTYLLHPPELAHAALKVALQEFVGGFAHRTGLSWHVRLPDEIDNLPQELQRSILRVVQEALTNVHRHANASCVDVRARLTRSRLLIRIVDDGHGLRELDGNKETRLRMGVGIPGMRARLQQFGGELRLKTGPYGTAVLAWLPWNGSAALLRRPKGLPPLISGF